MTIATDYNDPTLAFDNPVKNQMGQEEMTIVVGAKLTFKAILCQLLVGNLGNCCIADKSVDVRDFGVHTSTVDQKKLFWVEGTTKRFDGYNYFGENPEQMIAFFDTYMK